MSDGWRLSQIPIAKARGSMFSLFFSKKLALTFHADCQICMKCQRLFSGTNKKNKNIISLSIAESTHRVVKVNLFLPIIP